MVQTILLLGVVAFVVAWTATFFIRQLARRIGFVDKPGGRKIHDNPKALGGGVGILLGIAVPTIAVLIGVSGWNPPARMAEMTRYWPGMRAQMPMALGIGSAAIAMVVMGLWDDRKAMGPFIKLIFQLLVTLAVVMAYKEVRVLTVLGVVPSILVTVLWITAITNAFNFLDNMDGLSAGVAAVCTTAFLVTALLIQQWFVAAALAVLLGAILGFLCFNFPPASIFMGDAGSLLIGFLLGVLTVRTTFLPPGKNLAAGWYSVLTPVLVLALPLYDLIVVSFLRLLKGKSPFVGDTNHFSHRLVRRGMSKRTAVLCLYLISAATSIAAIVLPHVESSFAAILIFAQTLLILGVVMLLEQHPLPMNGEKEPQSHRDTENAIAFNPKSEIQNPK
jgi:UDP-GlcNAc:undecaprenyl-phosphate/decaprenyl-phosphate GlcNAc-1-phosphate transferase